MTYLAFDIDGTLYDCGSIIVEAFREGISMFNEKYNGNVKIPGKNKIIEVLGVPTDLIFSKLFPELEDKDQQIMNDLCMLCLVDMVNSGGGEFFDGVYKTLEKLYNEGYKLLIASNGKIKYIEAILKKIDIYDYFTKPIIVLDKYIDNKTKILKFYIENICKGDTLIMIGDRASDKTAASDNNVPFIGCSFGHASNEELKSAKWIAEKFSDIYNKIIEIEDYLK